MVYESGGGSARVGEGDRVEARIDKGEEVRARFDKENNKVSILP